MKYSACMVEEIRFGSDRHLMLNYGVFKCKLGGFEVAVKTASQKNKNKRFDPNKCDICSWDVMVDFH